MKCVILLLKLCFNDVRMYMAIFYFFMLVMRVEASKDMDLFYANAISSG